MTRDLGGHSPANVSRHLKGVDFPADKEDLIAAARQNGADHDVMQVLEDLPEDDYESMAEVAKAYGQVERRH